MVRALKRFSEVFDMMVPLYQLATARWNFMNRKERKAEAALNVGLTATDEFVRFPYAEGLLLLHSTRLVCLTGDERRARARRGRSTLSSINA
ncbi:unnamed protein product, partial [Discosporangium mesarthrocarpum]